MQTAHQRFQLPLSRWLIIYEKHQIFWPISENKPWKLPIWNYKQFNWNLMKYGRKELGAKQAEAREKINEWLFKNFKEVLDKFRKFANWKRLTRKRKQYIVVQIVLTPVFMEKMFVLIYESCRDFGCKETFQRIQERFYWPGMSRDVKDWVYSVEQCIARKKPSQKHKYPLQIWKPSHQFCQVALDIMGPLPKSEGFNYIHVIFLSDTTSKARSKDSS